METLKQEIGNNFLKNKFDSKAISEVEMVEIELLSAISEGTGITREICTQILEAGGKRIRPLLVLYSGMIFMPASSKLIKAAVAAELIHMASLVHDDIIDSSPLRHSKPSVNNSHGSLFAVLCGDYLFAKAFGVMARNRLIGSMDYMVHAIENMCQGEIVQAGNRFNFDIDTDIYYECISKKTAIFLESCCKSGACTADADEKQLNAIGMYGLNIGLAFQIIDDILDILGDSKVTGKPKFKDLCEGNVTLPLIMLLKEIRYKEYISEVIMSKNYSMEFFSELTDLLVKSGIINACFEIALSHIEKAKSNLFLLPDSPYTLKLYDFADALRKRAN